MDLAPARRLPKSRKFVVPCWVNLTDGMKQLVVWLFRASIVAVVQGLARKNVVAGQTLLRFNHFDSNNL
jgi:hypothetical protein